MNKNVDPNNRSALPATAGFGRFRRQVIQALGNLQRGETVMIIGAHSVIYSTDPEADHRFLRDVLRLPAVDGGGGYLIFGLPPAEASVHSSRTDNLQQELYLLCDNIDMFVSEMRKNSVPRSKTK